MTRHLLLSALTLFLFSCNTELPSPNKFSDEALIRIADFQDRRLSDSLLVFLDNENAEHRKTAILAFGSTQDSTGVERIGELLSSDKDRGVRSAAAFALGQIGGARAFYYLNKASKDNPTETEIDEALGKTAQDSDIPKTLKSWGLYRLNLRGLADSTHTPLAIEFLKSDYPEDVRLGAAHFFGRSAIEITEAKQALLYSAQNDSSVFVRMASVVALRKIVQAEVQQGLKKMFRVENDYRVRVNIIRALQPYPLTETLETLYLALSDENVNVAIASTEVLRQAAAPENFSTLVEKAKGATNWRVKANLYEAALATSGNKELSEEIVRLASTSNNNYEKAALIGALGYSPMQYLFVKDQLLTSEVPVVRTSSAGALARMNTSKAFEAGMQNSFLEIYKKGLQLDDAAVVGIIASVLADSVLGYKKVINDFRFLYEAKQKLTLPRDNEALQPLEAAIAYFEGRKTASPVQNEFNHPIDWTIVKSIPKNQRAIIRTSKGDIEIQLFVEEAPGSVANFLRLAQLNYFTEKNFHRVVPNFVIQGGCNRGDGWGSEDYSIRSEFSQRKYKEGSVGMASAGKDTEGTQWFITHSPTPHLDGRYTIFAEVISGMEVVHKMEVGDLILSVETLKE
ncbi:MAG: peptidylprolyl isomerase [Cyclobacteriaceae bacterium]|nr:peptidylprolyl isomerase [Cyclobacteriaceae bacterium]